MHRRQTVKNEERLSSSRDNVGKENNSEIQQRIRDSNRSRINKRFWFTMFFSILFFVLPCGNFICLYFERSNILSKEGNQVDMGWGQKMYIHCIGEGIPTIILDAPTGTTSDIWYLIQQQLSKISKVCVYDRAGLGFSDLPFVNEISKSQKMENRKFVAQVATVEQMTCDLHHLVTVAHPVSRPFIIVGAETGGLIARHYSMIYPEDVSDIVILNPLVEDLFWRQKEDWNNYWNSNLIPSFQYRQFAAYCGISRIASITGYLKADLAGETVPTDIERRQLSRLSDGTHMAAVLQEHQLLNTSFNQMNEVWQNKPFPKNISVTVINSRKFENIPSHLQKAWQQSQLYLRQSLHPTCKHYIFDGSTRDLFNQPATVVNNVQRLVYKWRINYDPSPTVHTYREKESLLA